MKRKVVFAPGSFNEFEGTQEELNEMVEKIVEYFEQDQLETAISAWDLDELAELDPDVAEEINSQKRTLQ